MNEQKRVVYSIEVGDLQAVAKQELGRRLTPKEARAVERTLDDCLAWYDAVAYAISARVGLDAASKPRRTRAARATGAPLALRHRPAAHKPARRGEDARGVRGTRKNSA
jgi:hypothetical protein